jgi:hypothetical protein
MILAMDVRGHDGNARKRFFPKGRNNHSGVVYPPAMAREELKAHLEAYEKGQAALRRDDEKMQASLRREMTWTRTTVLVVGGAIPAAVITLFVYAMQRTDTIEERLYQQRQQTEQTPPSSPDSGQ